MDLHPDMQGLTLQRAVNTPKILRYTRFLYNSLLSFQCANVECPLSCSLHAIIILQAKEDENTKTPINGRCFLIKWWIFPKTMPVLHKMFGCRRVARLSKNNTSSLAVYQSLYRRLLAPKSWNTGDRNYSFDSAHRSSSVFTKDFMPTGKSGKDMQHSTSWAIDYVKTLRKQE